MAKQKSMLAAKQETKLSSEQIKLFKVAYLAGAQDALEVSCSTEQLRDKHTVDSLFQALDTAVDKFESEGVDLRPSHAWELTYLPSRGPRTCGALSLVATTSKNRPEAFC